ELDRAKANVADLGLSIEQAIPFVIGTLPDAKGALGTVGTHLERRVKSLLIAAPEGKRPFQGLRLAGARIEALARHGEPREEGIHVQGGDFDAIDSGNQIAWPYPSLLCRAAGNDPLHSPGKNRRAWHGVGPGQWTKVSHRHDGSGRDA